MVIWQRKKMQHILVEQQNDQSITKDWFINTNCIMAIWLGDA